MRVAFQGFRICAIEKQYWHSKGVKKGWKFFPSRDQYNCYAIYQVVTYIKNTIYVRFPFIINNRLVKKPKLNLPPRQIKEGKDVRKRGKEEKGVNLIHFLLLGQANKMTSCGHTSSLSRNLSRVFFKLGSKSSLLRILIINSPITQRTPFLIEYD